LKTFGGNRLKPTAQAAPTVGAAKFSLKGAEPLEDSFLSF
jgi:hypothetical protein